MRRIFSDIPKTLVTESDQTDFLRNLSGLRGSDWNDLLKSNRILIVSEAGAGKTYECQSQQIQMWQDGEAAFFLELAELANTDVRGMLTADQESRFDYWLGSQSERATFFLDSYDELKLTLGNFKQALTRLSKAIAGQLGRARIIITSRPIPIDQNLFQSILPYPEAAVDQANGNAFADIVMSRRKTKAADDANPTWRNVAMMPLTDEQIREMSVIELVIDPDEFMAEIRRRNAEDFVRRPQDLIELCADWRDHRRIRSHLDQVASNIRNKLAARIERKEKAELSLERSLDGASQLALASLLARKITIRHSANADRFDTTDAALDPERILMEWTPSERTTLLERPLFGFSSYGRVRFHHRSVTEFLAAHRIKVLLTRGMSMRAAKRLLFTTTAQGQDIVRPSMRPVAAWLAFSESSIFEEIKQREPSTLFDYGDPESLSTSHRINALRAYVERYGKGGWRGLTVPSIQIHRFASIELGLEIKRLWPTVENSEVREMLLNIIEYARIEACADIAYTTAMDANVYEGVRMEALSALAALSDVRLNGMIGSMIVDKVRWPERIVRWVVIKLFPDSLGVAELCQLLRRLHDQPRTIDSVSWELPKTISKAILSNEALDTLRRQLTKLVAGKLTWRKEWPHIAAERQFLLPALAATCLRQLRQCGTSSDLIRSSVICLRLKSAKPGGPEHADELREEIGQLTPQQRRAVFDADDALMQGLSPQSDPMRRFAATYIDGALNFSTEKDATWVYAALSDQKLSPNKRALMLEFAVRMSDGSGDMSGHLKNLAALVADSPHLVATLAKLSEPAKTDLAIAKMHAKQAMQVQKESRQKIKDHTSWVLFWKEVADHPDTAFSKDRVSNTAYNLWKAMARSGDESRASGWNRRFITNNFGEDSANRLRKALMSEWRNDCPSLRSERKEHQKDTTLIRWQLGLAAISAEAEDADWATKLSPAEANLAVRYAPLELNGFPTWLESLSKVHPSSLDEILGNELGIELGNNLGQEGHSFALQNIDHASSSVALVFLPRLEKWLAHIYAGSGPSKSSPASTARLAQVTQILTKHGDKEVRNRLCALAERALETRATGPFGTLWLPILMLLDKEAGLKTLEDTLSSIPVAARGPAVDIYGHLFGDRNGESQLNANGPSFTPDQLLRLTRLGYTYVRRSDDVTHDGAYSPDSRDHAERGRDIVLNALLNSSGMDGWNAKLQMISDPLFENFKDRVAALARERAAEESDTSVIDESALRYLGSTGELPPATRDDMFALLIDRLDDLDDLLLRDETPRAAWALINDENVMRQQIAHVLLQSARHAYTVDQEAATADNKETDVRLRSAGSDQIATIELKLGEKKRSATELRATLRNQLLSKYMAPTNARAGCLLITISKKRKWQHPDTGISLDLVGLIDMLNDEAKKIQLELAGEIRIMAKGLDLTPRLLTEVANSKKKN